MGSAFLDAFPSKHQAGLVVYSSGFGSMDFYKGFPKPYTPRGWGLDFKVSGFQAGCRPSHMPASRGFS